MGPREYNDIMKFGAGDYKLSGVESHEIPPRGGLVETTRYTLVKFIKDLHAILRFNYWAALVIFITGLLSGSVISFAVILFATRVEPTLTPVEEVSMGEKNAAEKKSD